jgi:hypothetical protein
MIWAINRASVCLLSRVVVSALVAASLQGCSASKSRPVGSSVVVLVDFSKSFVPLSQDERALREVSEATAELAQREWQPPVAVLWSRIQTASLVASPLCGPFEFQQSLIKRDNEDPSQIDNFRFARKPPSIGKEARLTASQIPSR